VVELCQCSAVPTHPHQPVSAAIGTPLTLNLPRQAGIGYRQPCASWVAPRQPIVTNVEREPRRRRLLPLTFGYASCLRYPQPYSQVVFTTVTSRSKTTTTHIRVSVIGTTTIQAHCELPPVAIARKYSRTTAEGGVNYTGL